MVDARKAPPDRRFGWFTGGDMVDEGIEEFVRSTARRTGVEHPVRQAVAEVGESRRTREVALFDAVTGTLVGAGPGAWRWLGWTAVEDARMSRLPAETYGDLPALPGASR